MRYYYVVEWRRAPGLWEPVTDEQNDDRVALFDTYGAANRFMKEQMELLPLNHYRQRAVMIRDRE